MNEYRVKVGIRNNLLLKAIEGTGCKSVAEFCRNNGLNVNYVNSIVCMRVAPLNKSGEFSQIAKELMEVLGACPTDLWTVEQLTIKLSKNSVERDIDFASMQAALGCNSGFPIITELPESAAQSSELKKIIKQSLDGLTMRERQVISMRHGQDMMLTEIADDIGVGKERVRQIEAKALRKLRDPNRFKSLHKLK